MAENQGGGEVEQGVGGECGRGGRGQGLDAVVASASLVKWCRFVVQGGAATVHCIVQASPVL